MNRLAQQLLRLVVFVEQHGSTSDKLAAAEVRAALLPEARVTALHICTICRKEIHEKGITTCDDRPVHRTCVIGQIDAVGIKPQGGAL